MPLRRKPQLAGGQLAQRLKLVEEFIALDSEVQAFKPKLLRHEKLRQVMLDWYPNAAGEEEISITGGSCDILISSRDRMRAVTIEGKKKLFRLWGQRDFIAKCHVHLKSLPDPDDVKGDYTTVSHTGPRHLRVQRVKAAAATTAA